MPLMIIMWQFPLWLFPLLTPEGTIMCHGAFQFKNMKVIVSTGNSGMSLILYSAMSLHQASFQPNSKTVRLLSRTIFLYVSCVSNPHTTIVHVSQPADYQWHNLYLGPVCHAANKPNHEELSWTTRHLTASLQWHTFKSNLCFLNTNFTLLVQMRLPVITPGSSEMVRNECCQGHLLLYQSEPGGVKLALLSNARLTTWRTRISDGHTVTTIVRCQIIWLCHCE